MNALPFAKIVSQCRNIFGFTHIALAARTCTSLHAGIRAGRLRNGFPFREGMADGADQLGIQDRSASGAFDVS